MFGAPAARVKGRVREMKGTFSGGTAASVQGDLRGGREGSRAWSRCCSDPFALTPGFRRARSSRRATSRCSTRICKTWTAPFVMANINTRNVHRSNMLMGFPYGKDFVYDEMVLTGPGEQGEADAKRVDGRQQQDGRPGRAEAGRGAVEGRARERPLTICSSSRSRPTAARSAPSVTGDRDPGYGSTSKMISECAICLLRDTPDVPAGIWTPGAAMQHKLIKRLVDHAGLTFRGGDVTRARIVGVHPVHAFRRERDQQPHHPVADPGAGRAEFALAVAVAAGDGDDLLGTRTAFGLESLEGFARVPASVLHQPAEPHGVLQCQRGALAGMRAGGMRGVADQQRASARPGRQAWRRRACR